MSRTYHHGDKNKEKKFGKYWFWWRQEPKWWRKMVKHKPQRAKTNQALRKAPYNDDVDFPLDKKPRHWYW